MLFTIDNVPVILYESHLRMARVLSIRIIQYVHKFGEQMQTMHGEHFISQLNSHDPN